MESFILSDLENLLTFYNKRDKNFTNYVSLVDNILGLKETLIEEVVLNPSIWEDLSIFSVNGLFHHLQYSHTYFGFVTQYYYLVNPTVSENKHITIINKLVANPTLYHKIDVLLNQIRDHQEDILWFWKEKALEEQKLYDNVFFSHNYLKQLNKNKLSLFIYYIFRTLIQPIYVAISPILCFIIPYIVLRFKMGLKLSVTIYLNILRRVLPASFGIITRGEKTSKQMVWIYLTSIVSALLYIQTLYSQVNQVFTLMETSKIIKNRLNIIKDTLNNIETISNLLEITISKTVTSIIPYYLKDITKLDPTSSYLWRYWLLQQGDLLNINPFLKELGKYDMYMSLATFIKYARNRNLPISIPIRDIIDNNTNNNNNKNNKNNNNNKKSHLLIENIWHPCLSKSHIVVTNSFQLGNGYKRNMLVTGPNAGGKSTLVKAITINCLLAQTFGFTTSSYFSYRPYHLIYTHFRIQDLTGEKSLFQEEVNRCQFLFKHLNDHPFIAIFDELFCSTSIVEGISCAYSLAEIIGKYKNATTIITTHYPLLTNLSTSNSFINTQMQCLLNKDNKKPSFTYKLQKGISDSHVALDLLNTCKETDKLVMRSNEIQKILLKESKSEFIFSKKSIVLN